MKRLLLPFMLIGLAALFCAPGALAASEHANANSQGNASEGNGNSGNGQGNSGQGNGNNARDGSDGESPAAAAPHTGTPAAASTDQDAALDAVENGEAVPLATIVSDVKQTSGGEVLDAHQVTARGFLLYEIKVLEPGGRVKNVYYYAKSGRPVGR
jgi:hypothetical protein